MNHAALESNKDSAGTGSTNGRSGEVKESTAAWVQRTFTGTAAAMNTLCQEITTQDTRLEEQLANNNEKEFVEDTEFAKFKANEQVKGIGGKLWADQTEEVFEDAQIPDLMQSDEEKGDNEVDEEDQIVNDTTKDRKNLNDGQSSGVAIINRDQGNISAMQITSTDNAAAAAEGEIDVNMIDPGGTMQDPYGSIGKEKEKETEKEKLILKE